MSEKCIKCEKWLRKAKGPCKIITDNEDIVYLSSVLGKTVVAGNVLCNYCRISVYKKRRVDTGDDKNEDETDLSFVPSTSSSLNTAEEVVELPVQRLVATHKYCCICGGGKELRVVPKDAKVQCYVKKQIYIPKGNRCCKHHLIKNRFYEEDIAHLQPYANYSSIPKLDLCTILPTSSMTTLTGAIDNFCLSEKQLLLFTGLTWENIYELEKMLISVTVELPDLPEKKREIICKIELNVKCYLHVKDIVVL